jgi:hypothetical protein
MNLQKLPTTKELVKNLLIQFPKLRDNDNKLIIKTWSKEASIKKLTDKDLIKLFNDGKLSSAESIRRCRQKLQADHEELRGDNYELRHKIAKTIKKTIHDL